MKTYARARFDSRTEPLLIIRAQFSAFYAAAMATNVAMIATIT
jgi:hypothetical protein